MSETLVRAMSLHQHGHLDEAERLYTACMQSDPGNARVARLRGILARERGELDQSVRLLTQAAGLDGADPEPLAELALTLMGAGRLDQAEHTLRQAISRNSGHVKSLANLGALLQYRGHADEAIVCYRRVLAAQPDDLETRCNLVQALVEAGRGDEALADCDAALKRAPDHPMLLASRGAVLCALEEYALAVEVLEQSVQRSDEDDMAWTNLGFAHLRQHRLSAAASAFEQAVAINPDNARAASDFINVLVASNRINEGLTLAKDFLAHHAGERMVTLAYAYALDAASLHDDARRLLDYEQLIHISDFVPPAPYHGLADFNAALGAAVQAEPSLRGDPPGKATSGGAQTGEIDFKKEPFAVLRNYIDATVAKLAVEWSGSFTGHPAMAYAAESWVLRGWGTVLSSGGRQRPHIHPLAWLSGVYYVALPTDMKAGEQGAGWIEFGARPDRYAGVSQPVTRLIEPREGQLLIFPSYFPHRTLPFDAAGPRISMAFDVMPVAH